MLFESALVVPTPVRSERFAHASPYPPAPMSTTPVPGTPDYELQEILRSSSQETADFSEMLLLDDEQEASPDIERACNPMAAHLADRYRKCTCVPSRTSTADVMDTGAQLGLLSLSPVEYD
eukprot:m51a1_g2418 hypothetical protein (121) ;mRNA; f:804228-804724